MRKGDAHGAENILHKILKKKPNHVPSLGMLGTLCAQSGRLDQAATCLKKVLKAAPGNFGALVNLGNVLMSRREYAAAEPYFNKAVSVQPNAPLPYCNLGGALRAQGRFDEALAALDRALSLDPKNVEALINRAVTLKETGQLDAAAATCETARKLAPGRPEVHLNLGNILSLQQRFDEAVESYRAALAIAPQADVYYNLGNTYADNRHLNDAVDCFRRAIELNPGYVSAHYNLGKTLQEQGLLDEAEAAYQSALRLDPERESTNLNLLLLQQYLPDRPPEQVKQLHAAWGARVLKKVPKKERGGYQVTPDPDRVLRVGYISPDFCDHQVADFVEPILSRHDPGKVSVICYANVPEEDAVTERFRACASLWRDVSRSTDREVAEMVRADRIDILVDLAGHTRGSRLTALAHRPAPVQATYIGYPCTTGLPDVDYRFTDQWADPPGFEDHYTEELVRLDAGFCAYRPPDNAPDVSLAPVQKNGYLTFGCLLPLVKLNAPTARLWAGVLNAVPDARLLVFRDSLALPEMRERFRQRLADNGVPVERVDLVGEPVQNKSHLKVYGQIDLVLDNIPYGGHTTTCEALWMGVPVLTLAGERFIGRMGASLLTGIGLAELVCDTEKNYVTRASALAGDPERLASLRSGMRERMRNSPLIDGEAVTRSLEKAYREIWRRWCEKYGKQEKQP